MKRLCTTVIDQVRVYLRLNSSQGLPLKLCNVKDVNRYLNQGGGSGTTTLGSGGTVAQQQILNYECVNS